MLPPRWQTDDVSTEVPDKPIFVYGTLCIPEVRSTLLRRPIGASEVVVRDAEIRRVSGHTYPTLLLGCTGESVLGMILEGLTDRDHKVLRGFEPPSYDLVAVDTYSPAGITECLTFIHHNALALAADPWSPNAFDGADYDRFLAEVSTAAELLWSGQAFDLDARTRP